MPFLDDAGRQYWAENYPAFYAAQHSAGGVIAIAISQSGGSYANSNSTLAAAKAAVLATCNAEITDTANDKCYVYAVDMGIVWQVTDL